MKPARMYRGDLLERQPKPKRHVTADPPREWRRNPQTGLPVIGPSLPRAWLLKAFWICVATIACVLYWALKGDHG